MIQIIKKTYIETSEKKMKNETFFVKEENLNMSDIFHTKDNYLCIHLIYMYPVAPIQEYFLKFPYTLLIHVYSKTV